MLTKIMWNIVIEKDRNKKEEKTRTFHIAAFISNLLVAVEVGVFCLFLDKILYLNDKDIAVPIEYI